MKLRRALAVGLVAGLTTVALCVVSIWLLRHDTTLRDAMDRGNLVGVPWFIWILVGLGAACGGMIVALPYALVFEFGTRRAGALLGAAFGVAHGLTVWLGMALVAWFLPGAGELFPNEAFLLLGAPWPIAAFVLVHVAYGATVGALYGTPRHGPEAQARITWRELADTEPGRELEGGT